MYVLNRLKEIQEKYEPQNIFHTFREVFSRMFKILTTIVRREMEFIDFFITLKSKHIFDRISVSLRS